MVRPKRLPKTRTVSINLDDARLDEFIQLCNEKDESLSKAFRRLVDEELEKNLIGSVNPLHIQYSGANKLYNKQLPLTLFLKDQEMHMLGDEIRKAKVDLLKVYVNSKKLAEWAHSEMTGTHESLYFMSSVRGYTSLK